MMLPEIIDPVNSAHLSAVYAKLGGPQDGIDQAIETCKMNDMELTLANITIARNGAYASDLLNRIDGTQ